MPFRTIDERDLLAASLTRVPFLYLVCDCQGRILRGSPALEQLLGRPESEWRGQPVWECLGRPEEADWLRHAFEELETRGDIPPTFIHHWQTPNGPRTIEWWNQLVRDDAGGLAGVVSIGQDITERKLAAPALRSNKGQLELALTASTIGVWTWDVRTNEVYFSPRWKAQLGYEDHEIPNRLEEWETRLHPDDRPRVHARLREYLDGTDVEYELEFRLRHKDGTYRWMFVRADCTRDEAGKPTRLMGCHVDITSRKQAEEAMRDHEMFLRMAQHAGRIGSWDWDLRSGAVRWSDETYAIHGLLLEEFDGTLERALACIHPEDRRRVEQNILERVGQQPSSESEFRIIRPDGEVRMLWARAELVRGPDGQPHRAVGIVMDITDRQRAEAALRQSQASLEAAMSLARLGSWEVDLSTGLSRWSRQMYEIHDLDPAKGPPSFARFFELIHPADRPLIMGAHQTALATNRSCTVDYRTNPERGPVRHLTCTVHSLGEKRIGGIVQDISERKQAEQALRDSEERYRLIVQNMTEFIVRWLPDGTRTYVNDSYCRYFGLRPEEAVGSSFMTLVSPEHRELIRNKLQAIRPDSPVGIDDHRVILPSGEIRWNQWIDRGIFDAQGRLVELQSVGQDITDRKRAEGALLASERRFRGLIEHSADAISLLDARGLITYVSPAVTRILGWKVEELLGKDVFELNHPDELQTNRDLLTRLLQGESPLEMAIRCRHRDGSYRWLEAVASNRLNDPAIAAIVVNFRDISERRRLEEALRQAQKMEALGRLAGGLAHDFNNLLTVINGHADVALSQLEPDSPCHESLDEIGKAGRRAAEMVRQLLAFSRSQFLQPRVISIPQVVLGLERMLRRLVGEKIELVIDLDSSSGAVKADPGQLEQVIVNLVINAHDAMPEGGRLRVATCSVILEQRLEAREPIDPGSYVVLEVSDTGQGIDPAHLPQIFEPFFTTKPVGQGTGLGLATVYGIIKQSGGFIDVASVVGRGTTITVYLPAVQEPVEPGPTPAAVVDLPRGRETILLVEDQDEVRGIAARILQQAGYTVLAAASPAEALQISAGHAGTIHLFLSDVIMPNQNGPELIDRLKQTRPEARVLYMSGYMDHALLDRLGNSSNVPILTKPFTPAVLARKVREVLDQP